jgi:glyoxylate reductase
VSRVLVTRQLPPGSLDPLRDAGHEITQNPDDVPFEPDELAAAVQGADGLVCLLTDRIDRRVIEAGTGGNGRLKVVGTVSVGYDNVDIAAAAAAGVVVCHTPGVLDQTTADLAWTLIMAASRLTSTAERDLRGGLWPGWGIGQYLGHDVHDRVLGVVGWGRIGQAVARRAAGFDMRVIHHARRPTGEPGYTAELDELVAVADIVSLHVPLSPETYHLIEARRLALMKPTAVLVNTARGPVVDEAALAAALHSGALFAAGLDVYEKEPAVHPDLLAAPRTVLLPHIGSATIETRTAMARQAATGVAAVLAGEVPANAVRGT